MLSELSRLGLAEDPRVHFFPAIAMDTPGPFLRNGSHGAFLSHLEILKGCHHLDGPVLILQDDCAFSSKLRRDSIPEEFDIFYGGYHASDRYNLAESDIIGAHCMAFSPRIIRSLTDFLKAEYSRNVTAGQYIAPIDGQFVNFRKANPGVVTVFNKISYQNPSATDIGQGSKLDKFPIAASLIRKIKGKLHFWFDDWIK